MILDRYLSFVTGGSNNQYKEYRSSCLNYDDQGFLKWFLKDEDTFILIISPKEQKYNIWEKIKYEENFNDLKNILLEYFEDGH